MEGENIRRGILPKETFEKEYKNFIGEKTDKVRKEVPEHLMGYT